MKQHYLPECYLREFLNRDGKLNTLDLSRLKYGKNVFDEPKYPGEVCYTPDFYTIDPEVGRENVDLMNLEPYFIENRFADYETKYPKLIAKLKREQPYLQMEDSRLLMLIILDFKMRNPYYREQVFAKNQDENIKNVFNKAREEALTWEDSFFTSDVGQSKKEFFDSINRREVEMKADVKYAEKYHLASLAKRKSKEDRIYQSFSTHLLQFEWIIMQSDNAFITTDNPGFALDKNNVVQNTKFGTEFFYFFPLTPSLCFAVSSEVIDSNFRNGKKQLTIVRADDKMIQTINQMHGYHLKRFVFANNTKVINKVADSINAKLSRGK